jgi:hypothetical protein
LSLWLQEVHDRIVRELITLHHGQEINMQGDSFEVVFRDVRHAVVFCQEVQRRQGLILVHFSAEPEPFCH